MVVRVRLTGTLPSLLKRDSAELTAEVEKGSSLVDVMRAINVPPQVVMIYQVNGKVRTSDYEPDDGDEIVVIPAVAGG